MIDLKSRLKSLDITKLRMSNGKTVENELKRHAAILADCIEYELDAVYDSYSPIIYRRTYNLYNSLYIDNGVEIKVTASKANLSIGIHFDEGAIHKGFDGSDADTAILLNDGWQTHGKFANVPYFGYREATHFIENGIEKYKKSVSITFEIKLTKNGITEIY